MMMMTQSTKWSRSRFALTLVEYSHHFPSEGVVADLLREFNLPLASISLSLLDLIVGLLVAGIPPSD